MDTARLRKYLIITFAMTWALWWGDALIVALSPMECTDPLPYALFVIGGFGPTVGGCICLEGGFSWRRLGHALAGKPGKWGVLWFLVIVATVIVVDVLDSGGFQEALNAAPIPPIAIAAGTFIASALFFGGNEEIGWRGIMQPILERRFPFAVATLIVGAIWVCWHLPLWFIPGDSHQSMPFLLFAVQGLMLAFWLAAIHRSSGSVAFCMVLHGLANTMLGVLAISYGPIYIVGSLALTALAIFVGTRFPNRAVRK